MGGLQWAESAYLWSSAGVAAFLMVIVGLYMFKWRFDSVAILQVLAILLVN